MAGFMAGGRRRWQFVSSNLSVSVGIECLEDRGSVGDFLGGEGSVFVRIEECQYWIGSLRRRRSIGSILWLVGQGYGSGERKNGGKKCAG